MSEQPVGGRIPQWTQLDRLRKAREDAGLEQAELAERIGIGRATVGNYERGVTPIKRPALLSWAMATGVPLSWLQDGTQPDPGGPSMLPRPDSNGEPADYPPARPSVPADTSDAEFDFGVPMAA